MARRKRPEITEVVIPEGSKVLGVDLAKYQFEHPSLKPTPKKGRRNKFGAIRTEYQGHTYDSKAEAAHAVELDRLKDAGVVKFWLQQVPVKLGVDFKTRVDFLVIWNDPPPGCDPVTFDEVKGKETSQFKIIRRLWAKYAETNMRLIRDGGCVEIIKGKSA